MSDTPITDRAWHSFSYGSSETVLMRETAHQLEHMCNELAEALELAWNGGLREGVYEAALAKWQAMKDGK